MCMDWPCYGWPCYVDGLSLKCINVYIRRKNVNLINHDCLPILMLLYIMYVCLMLFAALSNAVCLYNAFFAIDFANAFCFYDLPWFIDT